MANPWVLGFLTLATTFTFNNAHLLFQGVGNLNTYWLICSKEQEIMNNSGAAQFKQNSGISASNKSTGSNDPGSCQSADACSTKKDHFMWFRRTSSLQA